MIVLESKKSSFVTTKNKYSIFRGQLPSDSVKKFYNEGRSPRQTNWPLENKAAYNFDAGQLYDNRIHDKLNALSKIIDDTMSGLGDEWMLPLRMRLSDLIDPEQWDPTDTLPLNASFRTFAQLITLFKFTHRPGVGFSDQGNTVAAWKVGDNLLFVECFGDGRLDWRLSYKVDGLIERKIKSVAIAQFAESIPEGKREWLIHG